MEKPAVQLMALRRLKNFSQQQQNATLQTIFSDLASQLEKGTESQTLQILNMLESLGKAAGGDLARFKIRRDESDEIGITGALVNSHNGKQYESDDLFGYKQDPLPEDDSLEKFTVLLAQCQSLVNQIDPENELATKLRDLLVFEEDLMVQLRRHKALCSVGLATPAPDEDNWHRQLHDLFAKTLQRIGYLGVADGKEKCYRQTMTCAWVWETSPPQCVLSSASGAIEDLSVRIYGVESVDCKEVKVWVTQDNGGSAYNQKIEIKKSQDQANTSSGVLLKLTNIYISKLQGSRKSQKQVKLYRVVCEVPGIMPGSGEQYQFKCSSLPFTVRSGSTQLWSYTSSMIWFIWAQRDLRKPDSECPKELEMNSVLALIQARIMGAGLRFCSKALSEKMKIESCSSSWPLHRLTDGERQGWADAVRDNCGIEGATNPEMVSRNNFIKHQHGKLYIWQIISAAVNTGLRLKKYDFDRFFHIGLSNSMCRAFPAMKVGDFILRSSLNRLDSPAGQVPYSMVVIQVRTKEEEADPVIKDVDDFDQWTLRDIVLNIKVCNEGASKILPGGEDVRTIEEPRRSKKGGKSNPYRYSNQEKLAPALLIDQTCESIKNLSLQSDQAEDPTLLNAQQIETPESSPAQENNMPEEMNEEPQTKKFAIQGKVQVCHNGVQSFHEPGASLVPDMTYEMPGFGDADGLCLDSLEESPPSSQSGARPTNICDERIMSHEDEDFIMTVVPQEIVNDVLLSTGSESEEPYIQVGLNMSPASMASENVWSPASDHFLSESGVGFTEREFLPPSAVL